MSNLTDCRKADNTHYVKQWSVWIGDQATERCQITTANINKVKIATHVSANFVIVATGKRRDANAAIGSTSINPRMKAFTP